MQTVSKNKPDAYSQPCQTSKMELFAEIVQDWKSLTIFARSSIFEVWQGSEYSSAGTYINLHISER